MSPEDPLTELALAAVHLHELFSECVAAGFTREEALRIICSMVGKPGATP